MIVKNPSRRLGVAAFLVSLCLVPRARSASEQQAGALRAVQKAAQVLVPLHQPLQPPQPGDWLETHNEAGQTFDQYQACDPILPRGKRKVLYILPVGTFSAAQETVVKKTAERLNVQVFATTHSNDCRNSLAAICDESVSEGSSVTIHRIDREKKESVAYTEQEVVVAAEHNIEVR